MFSRAVAAFGPFAANILAPGDIEAAHSRWVHPSARADLQRWLSSSSFGGVYWTCCHRGDSIDQLGFAAHSARTSEGIPADTGESLAVLVTNEVI